MATERDFEILDNYLGNRLAPEEKSAFEQQLASDPELKKELEFQQALVKGIRNERIAELKSMLNNVPVPSGLSTATKVAVALGIAAVASLAIYFLMNMGSEQSQPITQHVEQQENSETVKEPTATESSPSGISSDTNESTDSKQEKHETAQSPESNNTSAKAEKKTDAARTDSQTAARQPELNVFDPSAELEEDAAEPEKISVDQEESTESITRSSVAIETDNTDKKYNFHYQFRDGKLVLYGSFDKNLIEILEFFSGNKHTIFLYFNSNYYLLDEQQTKPALLKPIADPVLLNKLKESRNK